MVVRPEGLGPLPEVDRNDELQRLSFKQLASVVPTDRFILRDEAGVDKGIDRVLEAVVSGGATNLRAQIQMKGIDQDNFNNDGSFSYTIKTSNLNYLLNGQCPMYVIWISRNNELRFLWARHEARRLFNENPDWQEKGTVTFRFTRILSGTAWDEIHDEIMREGRMHREMHDALLRGAMVDGVSITVGPMSEVTTPEDAFDDLNKHGIGLALAGYGQLVRQRSGILSPAQLANGRIQLVLGLASFNTGDYFTARGHLGRIALHRSALNAAELSLSDILLNQCNYQLGKISQDEYFASYRRLESAAPHLYAHQFRFDRLRREYFASRDEAERRTLYEQLRKVGAEIESDPHGAEVFKILVSLALLYAESAVVQSKLLNAVAAPGIRASAGLPPMNPGIEIAIRRAFDDVASIRQRASDLRARADTLGHPAVRAEAIIVDVYPQIIQLTELRLVAAMRGVEAPDIPDDLFTSVAENLKLAVNLFTVVQNTEGQVRAKLILANWYVANTRPTEAAILAREVLPIAQGMGYSWQVADAEAIIEGRSQHQRLLQMTLQPGPSDERLASASEEDIRLWALGMVNMTRIPNERLPIVERACRAMHLGAIERVSWCRQLELREFGSHLSGTDADFYAEDSRWAAACQLFGYQCRAPVNDAAATIGWFKRVFCESCSERSPQRPCPSGPK